MVSRWVPCTERPAFSPLQFCAVNAPARVAPPASGLRVCTELVKVWGRDLRGEGRRCRWSRYIDESCPRCFTARGGW